MVKITRVIGQFKRFGRGPGVLMRGEFDDDQRQIPVHGFIHEFPIGLISSFVIGRELSCQLVGHGKRMRAEVLPFDNQPGKVISPLLSVLIHLANETGSQELEMLPMLTVKQSNVLPPEPQPEAEELDRLLELTVEEPDEEEPF